PAPAPAPFLRLPHLRNGALAILPTMHRESPHGRAARQTHTLPRRSSPSPASQARDPSRLRRTIARVRRRRSRSRWSPRAAWTAPFAPRPTPHALRRARDPPIVPPIGGGTTTNGA